jgi:hypothetical protein
VAQQMSAAEVEKMKRAIAWRDDNRCNILWPGEVLGVKKAISIVHGFHPHCSWNGINVGKSSWLNFIVLWRIPDVVR